MNKLLDIAVAAILLLVCGLAAGEPAPAEWWRWLLVAAVAVPTAVRSTWPALAAAVTGGAATALLWSSTISEYAAPVLLVAVALPLYSVGVTAPTSRSLPLPALGLVAAGALGFWRPGAPLIAIPAVVFPWMIGRLVRHRRRLAERQAVERADRAVADERLRIARDMHDAVAHHLSMITMKASVARHVASARPEEAEGALATIEESGKEALVEIRRAIGVLRDGPHSDLDLDALIRRVEQTGIAVELRAATVPATVRPVVHRIVQESLTNVIRHATTATVCKVTIDAGPTLVEIRVVDNGSATAPAASFADRGPEPSEPSIDPAKGDEERGQDGAGGHGLRGMRERVAAFGGRLDVGPASGGGFSVTASLPLSGGAR
ncbi:sensor histidine kinase [Actinoplanes sp. NPDC049265]|uniref:sensor histidine kinase n=1 Tax=Actinoplanes sp. NPDC049265 TaxID=3363902 RepID=UPI00371AC26F